MYDKAEEYLHYFSDEGTERKRIQAVIYSKTNRKEEAYKAYEEILFSEAQVLYMVFNSLYMLSNPVSALQSKVFLLHFVPVPPAPASMKPPYIGPFPKDETGCFLSQYISVPFLYHRLRQTAYKDY